MVDIDDFQLRCVLRYKNGQGFPPGLNVAQQKKIKNIATKITIFENTVSHAEGQKTRNFNIEMHASSSRNGTVRWTILKELDIEWVEITLKEDNTEAQSAVYCYEYNDGLCEFPFLEGGKNYVIKVQCFRRVEITAASSSYNYIVVERSLTYRSILNLDELDELYKRAVNYARNDQRQIIEVMYRNKPKKYWDDIMATGGIMQPYLKDYNGDPGCPINGNINGLFFAGRRDTKTGSLPTQSPFGEYRFVIPTHRIFDPYRANMFFADFYCHTNIHYVTVVLTCPGSLEDVFCSRYLKPLNPTDNPFFMYDFVADRYRMSKKLYIEVFYTQPVHVQLEMSFDPARCCIGPTHIFGRGFSKVLGIAKNPNCNICNLYKVKRKRTISSEGNNNKKQKIATGSIAMKESMPNASITQIPVDKINANESKNTAGRYIVKAKRHHSTATVSKPPETVINLPVTASEEKSIKSTTDIVEKQVQSNFSGQRVVLYKRNELSKSLPEEVGEIPLLQNIPASETTQPKNDVFHDVPNIVTVLDENMNQSVIIKKAEQKQIESCDTEAKAESDPTTIVQSSVVDEEDLVDEKDDLLNRTLISPVDMDVSIQSDGKIIQGEGDVSANEMFSGAKFSSDDFISGEDSESESSIRSDNDRDVTVNMDDYQVIDCLSDSDISFTTQDRLLRNCSSALEDEELLVNTCSTITEDDEISVNPVNDYKSEGESEVGSVHSFLWIEAYSVSSDSDNNLKSVCEETTAASQLSNSKDRVHLCDEPRAKEKVKENNVSEVDSDLERTLLDMDSPDDNLYDDLIDSSLLDEETETTEKKEKAMLEDKESSVNQIISSISCEDRADELVQCINAVANYRDVRSNTGIYNEDNLLSITQNQCNTLVKCKNGTDNVSSSQGLLLKKSDSNQKHESNQSNKEGLKNDLTINSILKSLTSKSCAPDQNSSGDTCSVTDKDSTKKQKYESIMPKAPICVQTKAKITNEISLACDLSNDFTVESNENKISQIPPEFELAKSPTMQKTPNKVNYTENLSQGINEVVWEQTSSCEIDNTNEQIIHDVGNDSLTLDNIPISVSNGCVHSQSLAEVHTMKNIARKDLILLSNNVPNLATDISANEVASDKHTQSQSDKALLKNVCPSVYAKAIESLKQGHSDTNLGSDIEVNNCGNKLGSSLNNENILKLKTNNIPDATKIPNSKGSRQVKAIGTKYCTAFLKSKSCCSNIKLKMPRQSKHSKCSTDSLKQDYDLCLNFCDPIMLSSESELEDGELPPSPVDLVPPKICEKLEKQIFKKHTNTSNIGKGVLSVTSSIFGSSDKSGEDSFKSNKSLEKSTDSESNKLDLDFDVSSKYHDKYKLNRKYRSPEKNSKDKSGGNFTSWLGNVIQKQNEKTTKKSKYYYSNH